MPQAEPPLNPASREQMEIWLRLFASVEEDSDQSNRRLAAELGVALGLVNAYIRRCVRTGLLKVHKTPRRRYAYFLTPKGFSEKSRLSLSYLSSSLAFFRTAKADCSDLFRQAGEKEIRRFVFVGMSDLAEIAALCAFEEGMTVVSVLDDTSQKPSMGKTPVQQFKTDIPVFDAVVMTDLRDPQKAYQEAVSRFGAEKILIPKMLRMVYGPTRDATQNPAPAGRVRTR